MYSPDGAWLYDNTEEFAKRPGHAQPARVPADGGRLEQLVDWFPQLSRDASTAGRRAVAVSPPWRIRSTDELGLTTHALPATRRQRAPDL